MVEQEVDAVLVEVRQLRVALEQGVSPRVRRTRVHRRAHTLSRIILFISLISKILTILHLFKKKKTRICVKYKYDQVLKERPDDCGFI